MRSSRVVCLVTLLILTTGAVGAPLPSEPAGHRVKSLKVTILSTMLADAGMGEWGFAALVEADGRRILFDTGLRPETVLQNARELGIDLSSVTDVVLSHHHGDHTGGLLTLRRELARKSPTALSRVHVAPGIFSSRRHPGSEEEANPTIAVKSAMEASGAVFVEHRGPKELSPGVWLTGPVPRPHPERNWGPPASIVTSGGLVPDSIPGSTCSAQPIRRWPGRLPGFALPSLASCSARTALASRPSIGFGSWPLSVASGPWWPRWELPSMLPKASIP